MKIIGVTGIIGSGKSTVARYIVFKGQVLFLLQVSCFLSYVVY